MPMLLLTQEDVEVLTKSPWDEAKTLTPRLRAHSQIIPSREPVLRRSLPKTARPSSNQCYSDRNCPEEAFQLFDSFGNCSSFVLFDIGRIRT